MIQNRFLLFKTRDEFNKLRLQIKDTSIAFIEGETPVDRAIWTNGKFYSSTLGLEHSKGLFDSFQSLLKAYPYPIAGDWAIIIDSWVLGDKFPVILKDSIEVWRICVCEEDGYWKMTNRVYNYENIDLSQYVRKDEINLDLYTTEDYINQLINSYLTEENARNTYVTKESLSNQIEYIGQQIDSKQDELINQVNIKSINGKSLLGSGNIEISPVIINNTTGETIDVSDFVTKDLLSLFEKNQDVINQELRRDVDIALSNSSKPTQWVFDQQFPVILSAGHETHVDVTPILEDIQELQNTVESMQNEIDSTTNDIESLRETINNIDIPLPQPLLHFEFLSQESYDSLEQYDTNTLYFILQSEGLGIFPITLT